MVLDNERQRYVGFSRKIHGSGDGLISIDMDNGNVTLTWQGDTYRMTIEEAVEAWMDATYKRNKTEGADAT